MAVSCSLPNKKVVAINGEGVDGLDHDEVRWRPPSCLPASVNARSNTRRSFYLMQVISLLRQRQSEVILDIREIAEDTA